MFMLIIELQFSPKSMSFRSHPTSRAYLSQVDIATMVIFHYVTRALGTLNPLLALCATFHASPPLTIVNVTF